jgi:hyperosmotically inducible periplasmic protein
LNPPVGEKSAAEAMVKRTVETPHQDRPGNTLGVRDNPRVREPGGRTLYYGPSHNQLKPTYMKNHLAKFVSLAAVLGAVGLFSGCAGTPTKESTGENIDDSAITAKVKTALFNDSRVKSSDISVTTFKGDVQLSGFVDNGDQKDAAKEDAKAIEGVKDVTNNITVK